MTLQAIIENPQILLQTSIDDRSLQLESLLGIGAYGIVYLGRRIYSDRLYAVKLLTNLKASRHEVDIQAHLSGHPNILSVEKIVHEADLTFIILEYASEGDLFGAITHSHHGLVGNNHAIRHIFLQIIDAVQHCHQNNIAHRDLKPENILMFPDWHIKLADFGLATPQATSTEFGCGSTFYFSPECQGSALQSFGKMKGYDTKQNDIWSLGVILVNFVAGRNPWKRASMDDPTFAAFVNSPHTFFETILPCISDELTPILRRLFCLDPARRISLQELRLSIIRCRTFTRQDSFDLLSLLNSNPNLYPGTKLLPPGQDGLRASFNLDGPGTMSQTLLDYISDFTDDEDNYSLVDIYTLPCIPSTAQGSPPFPPPLSKLPPVPTHSTSAAPSYNSQMSSLASSSGSGLSLTSSSSSSSGFSLSLQGLQGLKIQSDPQASKTPTDCHYDTSFHLYDNSCVV